MFLRLFDSRNLVILIVFACLNAFLSLDVVAYIEHSGNMSRKNNVSKTSYEFRNLNNRSLMFWTSFNLWNDGLYKVKSRKERSAPPGSSGLLASACNKSLPKVEPITCHQCKSNTKYDREPLCDTRLWKYLRHSEKARLRISCDHLNGQFCAKIVREKRGERETIRGCFGETMSGPNGTIIKSKHGCATFTKNGFIVSACLCDDNLCNDANTSMLSYNDKSFFFLFNCAWVFLLYIYFQ